jgi:predicted Ser/Thr protein kinase
MREPQTSAASCPQCGASTTALPGETLAWCPRCVMASAVAELTAADHPSLDAHGMPTPDVARLAEQLPDLEFEELLGRGGFAWVFLARQRRLDRRVAVKVLHPRGAAAPQALARFEREAQILARLNHPQIVAVYDYGVIDAGPYLVMEYVAGPTLREVLHGGPLEPEAAARIVAEACDAAAYAHRQGVLHRDLKPENLLLESYDGGDGVKVADFGIARLCEAPAQRWEVTGAGVVLGTPNYAAPEQMSGDRALDERTDVFSLGVVLYELLTGELPRGRFAPPSQKSKASRALDAVTLRCLESDPALRWPDAEALGEALRAALAAPTWGRRAGGPAGKAALVALGVAALAAMFWPTSRQDPVQSDTPPMAAARDEERASTTAPIETVDEVAGGETLSEQSDEAPKADDVAKVDAAAADDDAKPQAADDSAPAPAALSEPWQATISFVAVQSSRFDGLSVEFNCDWPPGAPALREGAEAVWVVETGDGRQTATKLAVGSERSFAVRGVVPSRLSDEWPVEVFLAEQLPNGDLGQRLSNTVRLRGPRGPF